MINLNDIISDLEQLLRRTYVELLTTLAPTPATVANEGRHVAAGRTVLVVEDEDAMREVTRRILVRNGYRVVAAASGREAIEAVKTDTGHIDLLLTDVVMPQMLGKEVADQITALRPHIRVLFMSGYAQPVLGATVRLADAGEAYLSPEDLTDLFRRHDRSSRGPGSDLTVREREVLQLLAAGLSNKDIAGQLDLSFHTIRNHVQNVIMKLGAHSKLEAVAIAAREGLVDRPA